jgi:putative methionine-R-sulfoxide reductase with GAF domain
MKKDDLKMLEALLSDTPKSVSLYANASAYLNSVLADVSWVGFYLRDDAGILYL